MEDTDILDLAVYELPSGLAERDICMENIEKQIERKRRLLLEKKRALSEAMKQNEYLGNVRDDYMTYYKYIVKKKEGELKAIEDIYKYTEELKRNTNLTEEELKNIIEEQRGVLREIQKIKKSLDNIVEPTSA
jgi:predicted DNA-binding ArsR family transcriptional regulator